MCAAPHLGLAKVYSGRQSTLGWTPRGCWGLNIAWKPMRRLTNTKPHSGYTVVFSTLF